MTIAKGDTLPDATFITMGQEGPQSVEAADLFADKTVVLFALPGAFTGVCTAAHMPSFIRTADQFREKGADRIVCVSVNDPFVMKAWGDSTGATEAGIEMLADPVSEFTKAVGMNFSAPPIGFVDRSQRYACIVRNGEVTAVGVEASPGECDLSGGEALLEQM
ncbi:peroxiredoxin [Pontivivens nitratireducens]|uniref:peroxiredoxin n=1 Tax=Pontivivens nitratireducens TaxID=2758038 RepID=UPI001639AB54|nr:peroxiredoxin [Pontibrevibacter nitratireducens]